MNNEARQRIYDHFYENHQVMLLDDDFNEIENAITPSGNVPTDEEIKQLRNENKKLRFMVENGLGEKDMENDI